MIYRTDLAVENVQYNGQDVQGYLIQEEVHPPCKMELVEICSEEASRQFGKPIGKYATVSFPPFSDSISRSEPGIGLISQCLTEMLPQKGCVLVMGLGNRGLTADALGPKAADRILATRHIQRELARVAGIDDLRPVAVCSPGVLGETGMETAEILVSLVKEIQPQAVIAIDALAAADIHRMGCTVQITDAGIAPGSGVGNSRPQLDEKTVGVPVIGIGVPTVVDARTMAAQLLGKEQPPEPEIPLTVTAREIDLLVNRAAAVVAKAVNQSLFPGLEESLIRELTE